MRTVSVVQAGAGIDLASRTSVAESWWTRLRGLLARPRLEADEGLLLLDCDAVHTAGMRYAIDVAFLSAGGIVVHSLSDLAPWRVGFGGPDAVHVLELPAGRLEETGTVPGMRLSWSRT